AAEASHRIGDIRQGLGRLEQAAPAYQRAVVMYRQVPKDSPHAAAVPLKLARSHNELGRVYRALQQRDEERGAHTAALAALAACPPDQQAQPAYRHDRARPHYSRAGRESPPDEPPPKGPGGPGKPGPGGKGPGKPKPSPGGPDCHSGNDGPHPIQGALRLLEGLVKEYPSVPDYRHLLACCYRDVPPERFAPGPAPGRGFPDRAVEILQQLADDFPDVPDYRYDLSETYARVDIGKPASPEAGQAARDQLERALTLSRKLVADYPGVPHYAAAL